MTQAKKAMKAKPKSASNFIKLDSQNTENEVHEEENSEPIIKHKNIISGSKEAIKTRGVIYMSHLPHGFFENQLRKYLEQFGSVTNIKVGRSEKTGKSKGYAFVEFRFHEVAKTVAETMNNYLFFDKLLKCELIPQEKIRPSIFRNKINPKKPPLKKARALAKREVNMERDERQEQKRRRKQLQGLKKKAATLQSLGIECSINFPTIEKEIADRKTRIKETGGKTPTMEVDDTDLEITLKTPPMVRKVKRKPTMPATPRGSSKLSETAISKNLLKRRLAMKVKEAKEDEPQVQTDPMNKSINKIKMKEKPIKGYLDSRMPLIPQIKTSSRINNKLPKSAMKVKEAKEDEPQVQTDTINKSINKIEMKERPIKGSLDSKKLLIPQIKTGSEIINKLPNSAMKVKEAKEDEPQVQTMKVQEAKDEPHVQTDTIKKSINKIKMKERPIKGSLDSKKLSIRQIKTGSGIINKLPKSAMKVKEAKEDEPQVQTNTMNKSINKIKIKEKPMKGSLDSKKLLTPQIKTGSRIINKSPNSAMKVKEAKEDEPQVQTNTMNKSINKMKVKEKPTKGSLDSKKLLTPQMKMDSGIFNKSPKSAKKNSMKSRRRSQPVK